MNPDRPFTNADRPATSRSSLDSLAAHGPYKAHPNSAGGDGESRTSRSDQKQENFKVIRFMFESASKLGMTSMPLASACVLFHRMAQNCDIKQYDPYLIGTTALYLASKIEEEHLKLRDVINVCHKTLHPDEPALDIGQVYWSLRESVAQCELFVMRMLQFRVDFTHPHKYLLHYLKSVQDWLSPVIISKVPIANTAWAILRDSYHGDICLRYPPEVISVSVLYMALQLLGVEVPYNLSARLRWWQVLVEGVKIEDIRKIITEIINIYTLEIGVLVS